MQLRDFKFVGRASAGALTKDTRVLKSDTRYKRHRAGRTTQLDLENKGLLASKRVTREPRGCQ